MAWHLVGTKPLSEPMLAHCQLDCWEHISLKFLSEFYHFHLTKCSWKCRLPKWRPFCRGDYRSSVNWVSIGSVNGLSPVQCQAITWTSAGLLSIGLLGTYFSEVWSGILSFWFKKIQWKMLSAKMVAILSRRRWVKVGWWGFTLAFLSTLEITVLLMKSQLHISLFPNHHGIVTLSGIEFEWVDQLTLENWVVLGAPEL